MKILTIIISLIVAQLAQLALAETYNCPAGQTNVLDPGQTIQTSGQPRCEKSHWVFGGSVSYGTDHWNYFLSSIRNAPRRLVRVQNVLQL
jgi:hypothetical protein